MSSSENKDILIVGPGRIGGHLGSQIIEGVLRRAFAIGHLWYMGRTFESARAMVLDHRDELVLRAMMDSTESERQQIFTTMERIGAVAPESDLSHVRVVVLCFGASRQEVTENRDSLLTQHTSLLNDVATHIRGRVSEDAIWLSVVNPIEQMCEILCERLKLRPERVIGIGATHDSARYADALREYTKKGWEEIIASHPQVVGPHSDQMIPLWSDRLNMEDGVLRQRVVESTRARGIEILRGRGSPPIFGPARALYQIIKMALVGGSAYLTASVFSKQFGCFMGLPAILGANGVEKTFEGSLEKSTQEYLGAIAAERKASAIQLARS